MSLRLIRCVHGWTVPFHRLNIRSQHHPVDHPRPAWVIHSKSDQKGPVDNNLRRSLPRNLVSIWRFFNWSSVLQCCRGLVESTLGGSSQSQHVVWGLFRRTHINYHRALLSLLFRSDRLERLLSEPLEQRVASHWALVARLRIHVANPAARLDISSSLSSTDSLTIRSIQSTNPSKPLSTAFTHPAFFFFFFVA